MLFTEKVDADDELPICIKLFDAVGLLVSLALQM